MSLLSPSLIAFRAVVQTGTVLEAATLVQLTQTGVTQRIRSLEKQLGVTLFTRSRKGMRLTQEGENLLQYVQAVEVLEGDTLLNLSGDKASSKSELKISGSAMALKTYVFGNLMAWNKKHPATNLKIEETPHGKSLENLKNGVSDFALLPDSMVGAELTSYKIKTQPMALVLSPLNKTSFSLKNLSTVALIDVIEENLPLQNEWKKQKRTIKKEQPLYLVNSFSAMSELLQSLPSLGIMPLTLALTLQKQGKLKVLKLPVHSKASFHLCWYKRQSMPVYMKDFISLLKEIKS